MTETATPPTPYDDEFWTTAVRIHLQQICLRAAAADLQAYDCHGRTLAHWAAARDVDALATLYRRTTPAEWLQLLQAADTGGKTPLQVAAAVAPPRAISYLACSVDYGDWLRLLQARAPYGETAAHLAAWNNEDALLAIQQCVYYDDWLALLQAKNNDGGLPLHDAAWSNPRALTVIRQSVPTQVWLALLRTPTACGLTPMHYAARHGTLARISETLDGAAWRPLMAQVTAAGETPLHLAARYAPAAAWKICRRGLPTGALQARDAAGRTPADCAREIGEAALAERLRP